MSAMHEIRDLYERKVRAMKARPGFARAAGTCTARLEDGFACAVTMGPYRMALDFPGSDGGGDGGPTPGQVMRGSLAACLAMGYRLWALRLGIVMDEVAVEMICELDARGQLGFDGVPVGWQRVAWSVRVVSDAPEEEVLAVLDRADRVSPMLANLDRAIVRERSVEIVPPPRQP